MSSSSIIIASSLALFITFAHAAIPSMGMKTAADTRSMYSASDFIITPANGSVSVNPSFTVRSASLRTFPVLGSVDVQTQINHATVRPGKDFITHSHPRGAEFFYVLSGKFNISIIDEGNSRTLDISLRRHQATVFPQGLIHATKCVSARPCNFLATFNSADPGFVPV